LLEEYDITVADVASVLAQMYGDSVCPGKFALDCGPDGVWLVSFAGLPDGCNVVDIDV
jgi:hypothetical protein